MKVNGLQDVLKRIGTDGCYFMSFVAGMNNGEVDLNDLVGYYYSLRDKNLIDKNCTVLDNKEFGKYFGYKYSYCPYSENINIDITKADIVIAEYFNPRTNYTHFVLQINCKNYDSLEDSKTVKEGYIKSLRLFFKEKNN